jgi:hypothetical protein
MSDSVAASPDISLSASKWYLWRRVLAMTLLPLAFSAYFFYDWKLGYPKQKVIYDEFQQYEKSGRTEEWVRHANAKGWPTKPDEITDEKIQGQFNWGLGVGIVGLLSLGYYLLSYPKKLTADANGFQPPWHPYIPFSQITKVDRRSWKNKGIAVVYYKNGDAEKKAPLDDLRFIGAQAILDRIQEKFSGEVVDFEEEAGTQDEADGTPEGADVPEVKKADS